jgi:hypothetical protein
MFGMAISSILAIFSKFWEGKFFDETFLCGGRII